MTDAATTAEETSAVDESRLLIPCADGSHREVALAASDNEVACPCVAENEESVGYSDSEGAVVSPGFEV